MITDYITHDEATIQSFMRDPEFADYYLQTVIHDGDAEEISEVQKWYNEAKARKTAADYWKNLISNAEITAKSGYNLENTINLVSKALLILKAAIPAGA